MKSALSVIFAVIIILAAIIYILDSNFLSFQQDTLNLVSPAFNNSGTIPQKYTCQGEDINPQLEIYGVPEGTRSLVLIIEDPDAPQGTWTHWVIYNIPPKTKIISENSFPQDSTSGLNSWEKSKYGGPCPPSGQHRYFFKLYALDIIDETGTLRDRKSVEDLMKGHILAQTQIIGVYSKQ